VLGVWNTLSPPGHHQLAVCDDVRYVDNVPQQRKSQPSPGAGECAHIEVRQVQSVRLGRTFVVGNISQRNESDRETPDRRQPRSVQLLVSILYIYYSA